MSDHVTPVPDLRVRALNDAHVVKSGDFVLYWMVANRRLSWNFSLQRAVQQAERLGKPLLILEALRCGYPWASDRNHRFVLQGMADNRAATARANSRYLAYVEPEHGAGTGLLTSLAAKSCVVVTDDFPCFFLPGMMNGVARQLPVLLEAVDSNGLLPLRASDRVFTTAHSFRRFLQKELPAAIPPTPGCSSRICSCWRIRRDWKSAWLTSRLTVPSTIPSNTECFLT